MTGAIGLNFETLCCAATHCFFNRIGGKWTFVAVDPWPLKRKECPKNAGRYTIADA